MSVRPPVPIVDPRQGGQKAGRAIAYDVTHLVSRLNTLATSGIDRVDLAYARHLTTRPILCGLHYGLNRPHRFSPERVGRLVAEVEAKVGEVEAAPSAAWPALRSWLTGATDAPDLPPPRPTGTWRGWVRQSALRIVADGPADLPDGAVYLNVAQHAFEHHRFFRWLDDRRDLLPVFLVHDVMPLDLPEFFRDAYETRFERRVQTVLRYARALITTSRVVADRVAAEYRRRGRDPVPIHVAPLPSPLGPPAPADRDDELAARPYFVAVSTIEPRKNHPMLLHAWRQLVGDLPDPPKLVLVGAPGWDFEPTLAMLKRSRLLARSVVRTSGLPRAALRALLANARALLMPSFAEGYGLPLVEALTLGTPVLASDIPVFREVTQGCAAFLSPLDGEAWVRAVKARLDPESRAADRAAADRFAAPTSKGYFAGVETFLAGL